MLWPTKGQKETGGETSKERKWRRCPWRQRWGRKWPACRLHRTSPQTAVQASASFQSPQPFHLLTDMMTFTLVFLKPPRGPVPLLCESQANPLLALLPIPVQFSTLGPHFCLDAAIPCAWLLLPCVPGSFHPDSAPILSWPKPPTALHPRTPGDFHCVHHPSYPHPSHTHLPLISEDCYLWTKPHNSWETHS